MKRPLFTLLFISCTLLTSAQTFQWVKTISDKINHVDDVKQAVDDAGNVYITRYISDTMDLDPGPGIYNVQSKGTFDMFIVKLDPSGNFVWAKQIGEGGTLRDAQIFPFSITVDSLGNIYTTGNFKKIVDFDPGLGVFNINSQGYENTFILKLDFNGNFVWAKQFSGSPTARSVAVDKLGNVGICGNFNGTTDFDPGPGTFSMDPYTYFGNTVDVFIAKLDASGNFLWAKKAGGMASDYGNEVIFDISGNIIVGGSFRGTVDFDPGAGVTNLTASSEDAFVLKLDTSGNFVWVKNIGGTASDVIYSLVSDSSQNVYTTGYFQNTVDFDPGPAVFSISSNGSYDAFVLKLNSQGGFLWAKKLGGSGADKGFAITLDVSGNVYTSGEFKETADFDPGVGVFNLTSLGTAVTSVFISKLDSSGNFVNAFALRNTTTTSSAFTKAINLDQAKNIYVTGIYHESFDFDPGQATYILTEPYSAIFTVKLSQTFPCTWTGAVNTAWENTGNWSCGIIPNASTNVIIGTGYTVVINSNVIVNTLLIGAGSNVTLSSGYNLTVLH